MVEVPCYGFMKDFPISFPVNVSSCHNHFCFIHWEIKSMYGSFDDRSKSVVPPYTELTENWAREDLDKSMLVDVLDLQIPANELDLEL